MRARASADNHGETARGRGVFGRRSLRNKQSKKELWFKSKRGTMRNISKDYGIAREVVHARMRESNSPLTPSAQVRPENAKPAYAPLQGKGRGATGAVQLATVGR